MGLGGEIIFGDSAIFSKEGVITIDMPLPSGN
jgi:hypothetical protein